MQFWIACFCTYRVWWNCIYQHQSIFVKGSLKTKKLLSLCNYKKTRQKHLKCLLSNRFFLLAGLLHETWRNLNFEMPFSKRSIVIGQSVEHIPKYTYFTPTNQVTLNAYRVFFELFRDMPTSIVFARETLFYNKTIKIFLKKPPSSRKRLHLVDFAV